MKTKALYILVAAALGLFGCKKTEDGDGKKDPDVTTADKKPEVVTVAIACGAVGAEQDLCKEGVAAWEKKTGHKVTVVDMPKETDDILTKYKTMLSAGAADADVLQVDVIWTGILASHLADLAQYSKGAENEHFPPLIENNKFKGKLVAMPWFTDAGVLYYRKDLLDKHGEKPPTTWEELTATAKKVMDAERKAGNKDMWGFVWQGKAYEGLTCDALEWISSYGGGSIVEPDGKISINNDKAAAALDMVKGWIGSISPQDVLNSGEEEARKIWQVGNAVFMRNWPYAWSEGQQEGSVVKDKMGVVALPKGPGPDGRHAATLGGWGLAVSKYSKNAAVAADLVFYLTGQEEQKRRAVKGSKNPTIKALYEDQDVLAANPFFGSLYDTFMNAQPRPSTATGKRYTEVSDNFFNAVHAVLTGKKAAKDSLAELQTKLEALSQGGEWK